MTLRRANLPDVPIRRTLSRSDLKTIHESLDKVFARIKLRILGTDYLKNWGTKQVVVAHVPNITLPDIYRVAAEHEEAKPDRNTSNSLAQVTESYLDAERERAKARVVGAVQGWLANSKKPNFEAALGGELSKIWGQVRAEVTKIVESSATTARNTGTLEGVTQTAVVMRTEDPLVAFIPVRDGELCEHCRTLHLLPDGITPRVWKLSEVTEGYYVRGSGRPSVHGLHPTCRCSMVSILPGYGFGARGQISFIEVGHDEYAAQRSSEPAP